MGLASGLWDPLPPVREDGWKVSGILLSLHTSASDCRNGFDRIRWNACAGIRTDGSGVCGLWSDWAVAAGSVIAESVFAESVFADLGA